MRNRSVFGIIGIAVFAVSFALQNLVFAMPRGLYLTLMALSVVLVIVGAASENRASK